MLNAKTRLAEAYTRIGRCSSKTTDLGFSYDAVGRQTDFYESTPDSAGYYHVVGSYWPNGSIGHARRCQFADNHVWRQRRRSTQHRFRQQRGESSATTYNPAGQVTDLTFGSGDPVHFAYDPNAGRMTQYKLTISGHRTACAREHGS